MNELEVNVRQTKQPELPVKKQVREFGYDIYPTFDVGPNLITIGYKSLAELLANEPIIKIDGYVGVIFESIRENLDTAFNALGVEAKWVRVEDAYKTEEEIEQMIQPFLGGDDPVFGKVTTLGLLDFFDQGALESFKVKKQSGLTIYYGIGAALIPVGGKNLFIDVSKNEIQYRSRAGSILNLGATKTLTPKQMYKRFYFVDWVVMNKHKRKIKDDIDIFIDGQRQTEITWTTGQAWRNAMEEFVKSPMRVRPWFAPGVWGGHWLEEKINSLSSDEVNYAWSFELIVPENGVIFESSKVLLEFSFDFLMYHLGHEILGEDFKEYQYQFPIRFDYLDTFDGGNLSIQCHPQKKYMKENFGEDLTQEETYYLMDKKDDAKVYLGFQQGVTPEDFRSALEYSTKNKEELNVEDFVQVFPAQKHSLYLIPPGTIHSSGKNNLVLEISSTPYIYTFKMYDWLNLDLDGNPRPLNIERGMENLNFTRTGEQVKEELISTPKVLESNTDFEWEHLPTHKEHLYDVQRYTIHSRVEVATNNKMHILGVVEGQKVKITVEGKSQVFYYAESFVIPASVTSYSIENMDGTPIKVVKAFIK